MSESSSDLYRKSAEFDESLYMSEGKNYRRSAAFENARLSKHIDLGARAIELIYHITKEQSVPDFEFNVQRARDFLSDLQKELG